MWGDLNSAIIKMANLKIDKDWDSDSEYLNPYDEKFDIKEL